MIQATKLTPIAGTNTYEPSIVHLRILASSVGEADAGAATLAEGERTVQAARGSLVIGDYVRLPDSDVYICANIEGLPPFFSQVEASLQRQGGSFVTRPFV